MLTVLVMAAVLWGIGWAMGAPLRARLAMVGALYAAVLAIQFTLPGDAALRAATGGSPAPWLALGGVAALVGGYGAGLG
ncbi:molybdopterin biosynthesis protein, partial [Rhodobacteraceae bacterium WD3A24]